MSSKLTEILGAQFGYQFTIEQLVAAEAEINTYIAEEGYVKTLKMNDRTVVLNGKDPLGYVVYYTGANTLTIDVDKFQQELEAQELMLSEDEWMSVVVSLKRAGL